MEARRKSIPILLYHAIDPGAGHRERYAVGPGNFAKQIESLQNNLFVTSTIAEILTADRARSENQIRGKEVVLSFDDGNSSDYEFVFPLLSKIGFKAIFFVTTGRVGTPGYVNWEQLQRMSDKGMSVQSHGVTHKFFSEMNEAQIAAELWESKDIIERKLRTPVSYFSLPGGFGCAQAAEVAKKIGFHAVCTSEPGLNPIPFGGESFRVLKRFLITGQTSLQSFQAMVEGQRKTILACKGKERVKTLAKRMIGSRNYYRLWAKYFKYLPRT